MFHGILLALFLMLFLKTEKPLSGDEGVLVNVGYMEEGTGDVQEEQPMQEEQQPPQQKQPEKKAEPEPEPDEELMTQDAQEAPSVEQEKEEKEEKEEEPEEKQQEPEEKQVEEEPEKKAEEEQKQEPEEEKPEVNEKALYKGDSDAEEGKDEGETGESGDQGDPLGSEVSDNHEGEGGMGEGISFSLKGRGAKHLPKPEYKSMDEGKVVVRIYVDKYGNVKRADAGARGTTVTDLRLRKLAEKAALRAKFSQDPEAPEIQKGTITYNFIRMQN